MSKFTSTHISHQVSTPIPKRSVSPSHMVQTQRSAGGSPRMFGLWMQVLYADLICYTALGATSVSDSSFVPILLTEGSPHQSRSKYGLHFNLTNPLACSVSSYGRHITEVIILIIWGDAYKARRANSRNFERSVDVSYEQCWRQ